MNEKIMVISNDGTKDIFKPRLIGQFIKEKTGVNDEIVKKIQNRIVSKIRNLNVPEITTTQIMAEVTAQLTKEGIKEEPYVIIKESDIMSLLTSYDNNNANQVFSAGALEYSLFEMAAKRYMSTQYSDEFREAKDYGLIYNHDSAQELFKGINCFTIDPRFIFKKGLSTYGDNNLGVISSPPKHLGTAINLVEEAIGLASTYIAGGVSIPSMGVFFAPFSKGLSDAETKQAFQEFFYRVNQSHKNRGCVSGDTTIWIKLNGNVKLKTFKEISDILNANYGSTDLTNIDLKILTLTDDRETKWVKPTLFWKNEPRELYEVTLPKGRSFKCDKYHGLISANNLGVRNILDIKKGTQLCDSTGINYFLDIEKNIDYWNGCLYGFWLGDGYKRHNRNRTTITVGKEDKVVFLDLLFKNLPFECNRTVSDKKTDEKHLIPQYINYHFDKKELVPPESFMENKNYLAGLITGLINSDGNLRIGNSGGIDCQFSNSNENYIDILRYAMFFFGIRANKNIKRMGNKKWSTVYRLNFEWNDNAFHLYKQLELRPLFKEALNDAKGAKWYGPTKRYLVKSITPLDEKGETFCFTANGRMIIGDGFILTSNSQSMFSSIQLDLEMPEFLKEQDAIGPGGEVYGKYKDYEEENKRLCHIITQISLEGDALGKPIFFPNLIYNIDNADLSEWRDVFELSARFSIPYFLSPSNNNVEYQTTLGCFSPDTSLWCKIDGDLQYISFKELDKLLEANIGATPIDNIEVLTVDDDKNIIWHKAKNFIKNEPQELYQIKLAGNKTFVCDKNHSMITYRAMNKKNILDCKSNLLDVACILNDEQSHLIPDKRAILYGFYLGDGKKGADFNKGYANLMLLKEDKIDYVRNLLDGLNIEYKEDIVYHSRDDANYTVFYFSSNEIQKPDLTNINCLAGLLSGLLSSDGYVRINGGFNKSLAAEFVSTDMEYTRLFKWACFNLGIKFSSRIIQPSKNQKNRQPFERIYLSCNYESVRILQQLTLRDKQYQIVQSVDNNYRHITETKSQSVKEIIPLHEADYTYCFEVNDRIIIGDDFILTGNCRSALPSNWTGDPNIDCMGTGNSVYTTLCLPAVALKSKEEGRDFYEVLDENMQLIHDYNLERLDWIHKLWYEYNVADFMIQKDKDGNQLYDLENATIVMGYLGLSEALEILGYGPIEDCNDKAIEIMKYMKQKIDKWKQEDNKRWGLFQTPAENATYKLAQKMVKRFGFKESYAKGTSERPYYTNSNHIPYDDDVDLIKRIKIEGDNQPLGPAGNIMNIYTSEAYSEPTALAKFCERIKNNTGAYFWAFTGDYSICNNCGTMFRGVVDTCTFDGSPTTQYSRVCGYITAVQAWNPGKKEEFIKRHRY